MRKTLLYMMSESAIGLVKDNGHFCNIKLVG